MKKILFVVLFVISGVWLVSCSDSDKVDTILISQKTVEFPAKSDSITLTTQGTNWQIKAMVLNGTFFYVYDRGEDTLVVDRIWCRIERRGRQKLFIKVDSNSSGEIRQANIALEDNGYQEYIKVIQQAGEQERLTNE